MKKITAIYGGFGFVPDKEQCTKPEYKEGLCKQHYDKKVLKHTPWGQREEYRDVTEQEFISGKPMLMKKSIQHTRYALRRKQMCRWVQKLNAYMPDATIPMDYTLYCVRKFIS
jgi:hypothetical protein